MYRAFYRGAAVCAAVTMAIPLRRYNPRADHKQEDGILAAIGNTPLIHLSSLSKATGCTILAKAEHMNPGGSVKDRPALSIITAYEDEGKLVPRHKRRPDEPVGIIIEATGGNTGLGMALVAASRGYKCIFTMPANIATEKVQLMQTLGAETVVCPVVPFSSPEHYYHAAKRLVETTPNSVLGNQFETLHNMRAHYTTTGPEIWRQANGKVGESLIRRFITIFR